MEAKDGSFGFDFEAFYSELVMGEKFTYGIPDDRQVGVKFKDKNGNTDITFIFDAETINPIEMQKAGWQFILDNFKSYVEAS
jgi:hypothetical protein